MKKFQILFLLVAINFISSCTNKSGSNLFDTAKKLAKQKKYAEAITNYNNIIKKFPESKFAPEALFEMAKMYQGQIIKNITPQESLKKAVNYYKEIYSKYPDSPKAESSIFMAAFILANELQDIEAARKTYNLYIKKYPQGELVKDAKIELQNLGKSPEEVLREKLNP